MTSETMLLKLIIMKKQGGGRELWSTVFSCTSSSI